MTYAVSVTRSGGGAVAVDRAQGPVKVVTANDIGVLVATAQSASSDAADDAAAAAASASAANASASAAASSASDAQTAQTAAELAETHAETAETNAAASALAAAGSASSASTSASTATTQAGIATTQAGLAAASAVAADASADAADASAVAAAASAASITLPLPIASGGTAATDAANARSNLSAAKSGANTDITSVYLDNTGLKIKDPDGSNGLTLVTGSNLSADRTLTFLTGNASRNLTLSGNADISGTNTGDQTITLTGDVTGTGTGSFAATIAADAVTNAKLADMAALTVKANATNGAANPTDVAAGTTGHVFRRSGTALAFGTLEAGAFATGPGLVTPAMLDNGAGLSVLGVAGSSSGARADIVAANSAHVLMRNGSTIAFQQLITGSLGTNIVTDAKFRQGVARSVVGVTGNATANVADIQGTTDQVLRVNGAGTAVAFGAIDLSKAAAATGVIQAASFPALTGDVTSVAGALATTIANDAVSNAKMANMAADTIKGRANGAGTGDPTDLSATQVRTILGIITPTMQVFTASGTWNRPTGCTKIKVTCVGGGGGGGGADGTSGSANAAGGGGGGGGTAIEYIDVSALSSAGVTVGAAGSAGTNVGGNGGAGGTSSFGTGPLLQATGGSGGTGTQESGTGGNQPGGAGGVGSSADLNLGGGGGGNGGYQAALGSTGGVGGSSTMGGGGVGGRATSGSQAGSDGRNYGGGGGGGASFNTTSGSAGGAGAAGVVIVEEYY